LISAGHKRDDILEYTIDELEIYQAAIERAERSMLATLAPVIYVGTQGDNKAVNGIVERLTEG